MTVVPEQEHDPEFDYLIPPPRPRLTNLNIAAQGTVLTSENMGKGIELGEASKQTEKDVQQEVININDESEEDLTRWGVNEEIFGVGDEHDWAYAIEGAATADGEEAGSTINVEVDEQEQEQVDDLPQPTTPPRARRRKLSEVVSPSPIWTNMHTSPLQIRPVRRLLPPDSPPQRYPTRARKRSKKEEARQNEVIQVSDDDEEDEGGGGRASDDDFKGR